MTNFDDYAYVDKDAAISVAFSDEKIIAKIQQKNTTNNEESEDCDKSENEEIKEVRPITKLKIQDAVETLCSVLKISQQDTEIIRNQLCDLETFVLIEVKSKERIITSYFQNFKTKYIQTYRSFSIP